MPRIKDVTIRFWADTLAGLTPKFDYELDADVVAALHPRALIPEPPLDLSADNLLPELLAHRARRKDYVRRAEKWIEKADAEVKDKLGPHATATLPGWKISYKNQRREARVMEACEFRVLRVTPTRGKT